MINNQTKYYNCCECKNNKKIKIFTYNKPPKYEQNFSIKGVYKREYLQCNKCQHMFNRYYMKWGANVYNSEYFKVNYINYKTLKKKFDLINALPVSKSDNKNRVNRVIKFCKKKDVLDIGSGTGVFLYQMKKKGWNVNGIEVDKRFANFSNIFKLNVVKKNILNCKFIKKFDLITFNKVLEHVVAPIKVLKASKKFLKKDGIIYIELPSVKAKRYGKNRSEFCIDHFQVFSKKSIKFLINKCGFKEIKIKEIKEPSGKLSIYCFAKI